MMPAMALAMLFGVTAPAMATEYVYELTNQLTAGEFLIVNINTTGSGFALGHDGGSVDSDDAVTVSDDNTVANAYYIEETDVNGTSKWTVTADDDAWTFKNGNWYVSTSIVSNLEVVIYGAKSWTYNATNHSLFTKVYPLFSSPYNHYLTYNDGFRSVTSQSSIYLYKKVRKKAKLTASTSSLSFNCEIPNIDSKTFNVTGAYLRDNVNVALDDPSGVFIINPTSFTKSSNNTVSGTVTVTFTPNERDNHNYTGKVTLTTTEGNTVEITLNANSTDKWIDATITSAQMSTFYCDFPVIIPKSPTGLQNVKYVYRIQGNSVILYDWSQENNHIPANSGMILEGNPGTYRFYKYHGTVNSLPEECPNLLSGTCTQLTRKQALEQAGKTEDNAIIMTLAPGKSSNFGFYKFIGDKLAPNKAFLIYDTTSNSNVSYLSIGGGGGEDLDGIRDVKSIGNDDAWYTLQGARLNGTPTQRGIYIHGGKKVAVK